MTVETFIYLSDYSFGNKTICIHELIFKKEPADLWLSAAEQLGIRQHTKTWLVSSFHGIY